MFREGSSSYQAAAAEASTTSLGWFDALPAPLTRRKKTISNAIAAGEVSKMPLMCSWPPPDMVAAVDYISSTGI